MLTFGELMAQVVGDAKDRLGHVEKLCCACDIGAHHDCAGEDEACGCHCRERWA